MLILFLFAIPSLLYGGKEEMRVSYPDIWKELNKMGYTYTQKEERNVLPLEKKTPITYTAFVMEDNYLWHTQKLNRKVF